MFNVDGKEFIFLVLIALVVLGPEKLPDLFRRLGKAYAEFRRLSDGFQEEFRKAVEEPVNEVKKTGDMVRESVDFRTPSDGASETQPSDGSNGAEVGGDADAPGFDEQIDPGVYDVDLPEFSDGGEEDPDLADVGSANFQVEEIEVVDDRNDEPPELDQNHEAGGHSRDGLAS